MPSSCSRFACLLSFSFSLGIVAVSPALAQQHLQVPEEGMFAVGVSAGVGIPSEELLKKGWFIALSGEAYLTPRVSLRAQIGGAWFDVFGRPFDGRVSPMNVTGNVVYNWERGQWHPYATGGIGVYRLRYTENDFNGSDTKLGLNLGGGVEYFLSRRDTITGEVTLHAIHGDADITGFTARYWTIAGGYKLYF